MSFIYYIRFVMNKIVLLVLLIASVASLHLHNDNSSSFNNTAPKIRKSIRALNATARKSFFWSLKALAVLPAPKAYDYWTYSSLVGGMADLNTQRKFAPKPRCLHDILIASHQSSAEHRSFYFISYHRHWMVLYEIWLGFAHEVLRGGKQKLLQHYPADVYENYSSYWDAVFADYKNEKMSEITEMAAHYWNPTNFKVSEDILFPKELDNPKDDSNPYLDNMDKLLYAVRRHYAWQLSVKTRMVTDDYEWNEDDIVQRLRRTGFFNSKDQVVGEYSKNQKNLLDGKLSARSQPQGQTFDTFNKTFAKYLQETGNGDYKKHVNERLENYFFTVGQRERVPVTNMTDAQLLTSYGGEGFQEVDGEMKFVKHTYISKAERRAIGIPFHKTMYYNKKLPPYSYAYALFNRLNVPTYVEYNLQSKGIGYSHSKMHNYHGNAIQIIGLNIYVFHGWIQCQIQMKIRMFNYLDEVNGNKRQYEAFSNYLKNYHRRYQNYMFKRMLIDGAQSAQESEFFMGMMRNELRKYYEDLAAINGSIFSQPISQNYTGFYTVFEWTNPLLQQKYRANASFDDELNTTIVFPVRDYLTTTTRLRSSLDLADIYNRIYIPLAGHRFQGFVDLTKYKFNFDYQIYNGPDQPKTILNHSGQNVPEYLEELRQDVEYETYDVLDNNINRTIEYIYHNNFSDFNNLNPKLDDLYKADPDANYGQIKSNLITYYTGYLRNMSYTFAQYPSSKENGVYEIRMKLDPEAGCVKNIQQKLSNYDLTLNDFEKWKTQGVVVQYLNITSNKGLCLNCPQTRKIYLDADADLLDTNFDLWKSLRKIYTGTNTTLAYDTDSSVPLTFTQCFAQNVKYFVPENLTEGQKPIQVWPVQGLQEFSVTVVIQGLPQDQLKKVEGSLIIEATVASGANPNDVIMKATKGSDWVNGVKFAFPKLNTKNKDATQNDLRTLLYTKIQFGWQQYDDSGIMAIYTVPHFSTHADFKLVAAFPNGQNFANNAKMRIQDMDYNFKSRLFWNFNETI